MISKDYLDNKQNKYLINIVTKLIISNEIMKIDMHIKFEKQYVDLNKNILNLLLLSLISFCFLLGMKYLYNISMTNTFIIESNFDLYKVIYSSIILQLIYISIYLKEEKFFL